MPAGCRGGVWGDVARLGPGQSAGTRRGSPGRAAPRRASRLRAPQCVSHYSALQGRTMDDAMLAELPGARAPRRLSHAPAPLRPCPAPPPPERAGPRRVAPPRSARRAAPPRTTPHRAGPGRAGQGRAPSLHGPELGFSPALSQLGRSSSPQPRPGCWLYKVCREGGERRRRRRIDDAA